jgi:hypothetical protein
MMRLYTEAIQGQPGRLGDHRHRRRQLSSMGGEQRHAVMVTV